MKNFKQHWSPLFLAALFLSASSSLAQAEDIAPRELWDKDEIQVQVASIDSETREIVLRGPAGNLFPITATEDIQRFDEIEVGDTIKAEFWTYVIAEFREPTEVELQMPFQSLSETQRTPAGAPIGGAIGEIFRAVVTVEIIDRPDMSVTVKGPRGRYVPIPVQDEELITQLQVGNTVIIEYAEAIALSLEKAE